MEARFERKEDKPPRNLTLLAFGEKAGKVPLKRVFLGETPMTIKGRGVTTQDASNNIDDVSVSEQQICLVFNAQHVHQKFDFAFLRCDP